MSLAALLAALPWLLGPLVVARRMADSRSLDEFPAEPPPDAPPVSVIVPARNERRNIERCVRSALGAAWPRLEVLVVDDHSDDGTGEIARAVAAEDGRLRVVENPPLPPGWFGKPWACATGAREARGELLLFVDADTRQAPDLVPRGVAALRAMDAGLLSVAGRQELGSFWERVVQPQVFTILLSRYGGTERVNRSPHVRDKIANGQCILVRRDAYEAVGGHGAVRHNVAEDVMLAQRFHAAGRRPMLVLGEPQLATRMYTSLADLAQGWMKNVYAGGRDMMPGGVVGRVLFPVALLLPPLFMLAPVAALLAGLVLAAAGGVASGLLAWGALTTAASLGWWAVVYRRAGVSAWYALAYPAGAAVLLWIFARAIGRGRRVRWKGREYT